MPKQVMPYRASGQGKKAQIEQMFDNISGSYDGLNRVISFGMDGRWRRKVIRLALQNRPERVLDVATGTGGLAISFAKKGVGKVMGLDLSEGMLAIARKKAEKEQLSGKVTFTQGDSENMPFDDGVFDAITVAFGVRNFEDLERGLAEIHRVLKPGGRLVVLETSVPEKTPFRQGYRFYCGKILPFIGRVFSRDKSAYRYLAESASVFPYGQAFNNKMVETGFIEVENKPQIFGVATIYTAAKK